MADSLLPETPENGGGHKASEDTPSDKHRRQPEKKLGLPDSQKGPKSGLTPLQWSTFATILGGNVLWAWPDLIHSHDISDLIFYSSTLLIGHSACCYFLTKLLKSRRWSIFIWFASTIAVSCVAYRNSRPVVDPKAYRPLPTNVAWQVVRKLRESHNQNEAVMIHAFDPDEAEFGFAMQLQEIFRAAGYAVVTGRLPSSAPEAPGITWCLYGMALVDSGGLREAMDIIRTNEGQSMVTFGLHDEDPWLTNSVVVILIRKK